MSRFEVDRKGLAKLVEKALAAELLDCKIGVTVVNDAAMTIRASYGDRSLTLNAGRLGWDWFNHGPSEDVDQLLIHEFGHHFEENHLSDGYHRALCRLGARMVKLALDKPDFFKRFGA